MESGTYSEQGGTVQVPVAVRMLASGEDEKPPQVVAYAFSTQGRLLDQAPVDEKGQATLRFPAAARARGVRILAGPAVEREDEKEIDLAEVQRRGADERLVRLDPRERPQAVEFIIPVDRWRCWILGLCFVEGTLVKRVPLGPTTTDLPVCRATVEIYEVERWEILIPRFPDHLIEQIRQYIINPPPPPPPERGIGPFPPVPPGPLAGALANPGLREAALALEPEMQGAGPLFAQSFSLAGASTTTVADAANLQFLARTADTQQFRQALVLNVDLIRHILCLLYPFPVTMHRVATATTDECGHFRALFFRGCAPGAHVNLYFKATQRIFPFLPPVVLYAPTPVPCYTHWNYPCGTEVTLVTTNPLAITCACPPDPVPDKAVVIQAIGDIQMHHIYGTSATLNPSTTNTNRGLTRDAAGNVDRPWGGDLRPRLEFDPALLDDDVRHYQVSWRRGESGPWTALTHEVHRHYTHWVGTHLVKELLPLGPHTVGTTPNLYDIPPELPPAPGGWWTIDSVYEDTINAHFPTADIAPGAEQASDHVDHGGKYQIKVDLYDSAGNLVNIAAKGVRYFVSTETDPLDAATLFPAADPHALVQGNSFIMTLHIDNNYAHASIAPPTLNGTAASPECGVLEYPTVGGHPSGTVEMDWTASHLNGFATYSFVLYKGAYAQTLPPPPAAPTLPASGQVPAGTGNYANTQTVSDLLGGCPAAGFSENLYVAALATDGFSRQSQYDASAVFGYAVVPQGVLPANS